MQGILAMNRKKGKNTAGPIIGPNGGDPTKGGDRSADHGFDCPAFAGEYEFDLTLEMFGQRITRRAKILYEHTPFWEFFDLKQNAPLVVAYPRTSLQIEILAIPQEFHEDGTVTEGEPHWVAPREMLEDGVLPEPGMLALLDAIDARCMAEDVARRTWRLRRPLRPS
jgi:hypothetical protein